MQARRNGSEPTTVMVEERSRAIDLAIGQIEKQFGRGAIMRLGEQNNLEIEAIPTGSLALDLALGIGGVPRGRITELFGPESSGKSTLCQHIIAEAQRMGGLAATPIINHPEVGILGINKAAERPAVYQGQIAIRRILHVSGSFDHRVVDGADGATFVQCVKGYL